MSIRVLIVDDAAFMRMMLKDILTKAGYEIVGEAASGLEAVERFKEVKPDLITMDITMPEMDGIEAVRNIRKIDSEVKILMVSAMGQQKLIIESLEAGANDFIVKPFQPAKVIEIIEKVLSRAKV
ncbi:MAG: response regulator [Actinobacteria bacterium]|nr:response regulator [Actinomycetota bacterium]